MSYEHHNMLQHEHLLTQHMHDANRFYSINVPTKDADYDHDDNVVASPWDRISLSIGYWNLSQQNLSKLYMSNCSYWCCQHHLYNNIFVMMTLFTCCLNMNTRIFLFALFIKDNFHLSLAGTHVDIDIVNHVMTININFMMIIKAITIIILLLRVFQLYLFFWLHRMYINETTISAIIGVVLATFVSPIISCLIVMKRFNCVRTYNTDNLPILVFLSRYMKWILKQQSPNGKRNINVYNHHDQLQFDECFKYYEFLMQNFFHVQLARFYHMKPRKQMINVKKSDKSTKYIDMSVRKWKQLYIIEMIIGCFGYALQVFFAVSYFEYCVVFIILLCIILVSSIFFIGMMQKIRHLLSNDQFVVNNVDQSLVESILTKHKQSPMLNIVYGKRFMDDLLFGKNNINRDKIKNFIQLHLFYKHECNLKFLIDTHLQKYCTNLDSVYNHIPTHIVTIIIQYTHITANVKDIQDLAREVGACL